MFTSIRTGMPVSSSANDAVVVLDRERRRRHLLRRLRIAAAAVAREDRAAVDALCLPRQIAAARGRGRCRCRVRAAPPTPSATRNRCTVCAELLRRRLPAAAWRAGAATAAGPALSSLRPCPARSSAARRDPRACARGAPACRITILPRSWPLYFARSASLRMSTCTTSAADRARWSTASTMRG